MKIMAFLLTLAIAFTILSGCSQTVETPKANPSPENAGKDEAKGKTRPKPPPK